MATTCRRCGAAGADEGLAPGWSLHTTHRGLEHLCATCTRDHVRDIEAKLDEDWWQ